MRNLPSVALALVMLAAACTPYAKIDSGQVHVGSLAMTTGQPWARIQPAHLPTEGPTEVWTRDGLSLNQVLVYAGLADGRPLFAPKNGAAADRPFVAFRQDMLEADVHELVVDSIGRYFQAGPILTTRVAPRRFAGADGFEAEFAFASKATELEYRAIAAGAVIGGHLHLLVYVAPRLHYFDAHVGAFRQLVDTASLAKT